MKVTLKEDRKINFGSLFQGDTFRGSDDVIYLKVDYIEDKYCNYYNAANLEDGTLASFDSAELVTVINGTFTED